MIECSLTELNPCKYENDGMCSSDDGENCDYAKTEKYRELYITEDLSGITADQKRFFIPKSEDDFFVHESMFDGTPSERIVIEDLKCIQVDCRLYISLNELIDSGKLDRKTLKDAHFLKGFLTESYEGMKG